MWEAILLGLIILAAAGLAGMAAIKLTDPWVPLGWAIVGYVSICLALAAVVVGVGVL